MINPNKSINNPIPFPLNYLSPSIHTKLLSLRQLISTTSQRMFNQQFYMTAKKQIIEEVQTGADTPFKTMNNRYSQIEQSPSKELLEFKQNGNQMSLTQTHLNSRSIVNKLLSKAKYKTVRHEINRINKESPLYSRPSRHIPREFQFKSIPPDNPHYSSSCSAKIKQINQSYRRREKSALSATRYQTEVKQSSAKSQDRVSVSGLITYKFSSVNAQRSLGFNQINHQQKMKEEIRQTTKMSLCPTNRYKQILLKNNHAKYKERLRQERSILNKFEGSTDDYLKNKIEQNQQQLLVYGQKARKLHFIKEYMHSENATYSEGRHIIDQIQRLQPKESVHLKSHCKTQIDEDLEISRRIMPVKKKRVKVRFLTFVD